MKKETAIIAIVAIGVLGFVVGRMASRPAAPTAAATPEGLPAAAAPAAPSVPSYGPEDAKVTIVEISDFQCPFCSRAAGTIEQLKKDYAGSLRVVFVNQPLSFHNRARPAAIAALAAHRQGKFWQMHDKLFANAREMTDENIAKWAGEIGLDKAKFDADLKDPAIAAQVDRDQAIAGALGVNGTPGFFVNGVNVSGAQPIENFKKIIDEQLTKAAAEIAKGTKPADLNEKLTRANNPEKGANLIGWIFKGEPISAKAADAGAAPEKAAPPPEDKTVWKTTIRGQEPTKGPADALITLVEYTDFECPFCSKARGSLAEVEKAYAGKVRFVFKNQPLPFHKKAQAAAEAALCAMDQGKFWEMEERLFTNQQSIGADQLPEHAKAIGLDVAKWQSCMDARKFKAHIEADQDDAAKVQATGTPAFYINGRKLSGAQPFDAFKKLIDEEMTKAQALVQSGTAAKDVFAKTIADGKVFTPPPPLDPKVNTFDYAGSPHRGPRNAAVKIVEYKEFQCPYCARVNPTMKQVEKNLRGKVAIVFKHFPLSSQCNPGMGRDMHPAACTAAYWSFAAEEQGKFWEFEDVVFNNMQSMMPQDGALDARLAALTENMKKYAAEAGMDVAKAEAFVKGGKYQAKLTKDLAEARAAEVGGTPSIFINGRSYNAAMTPEKMTEIAQQILDGKL
jgi:protein-disulfide isomerase